MTHLGLPHFFCVVIMHTMLGKFVPNINDAMSSSLGKHVPKPIKQQVKGGSNVLSQFNLPGPFSGFNQPKPQPKPKQKPKLKENIILPKGGAFNPLPKTSGRGLLLRNIIAQLSEKMDEKQKPKPKVKAAPKPPPSAGGVNLMNGKWVKNPKTGISSWKPNGLGRDMTNEEYRYVRKEWIRTNDPNNDRFKAPKQPPLELKWRDYEPEPGEFLY